MLEKLAQLTVGDSGVALSLLDNKQRFLSLLCPSLHHPFSLLFCQDLSDFDDVDDPVSVKLVIDIIKMIIEFIRTAPDTQASNVAGTAIQDLLPVCGCSTSSLNDRVKAAMKVWNQFDEDERTLLFPFLSSKYEVKHHPPPSGLFFERSETFRKWVGDWGVYLASRLPNNQQKMFGPCRLAMQWDSRLALFLLPHLLLRVGLNGEVGVIETIQEEINCVVARAALEEPNVLRNPQVVFFYSSFLIELD